MTGTTTSGNPLNDETLPIAGLGRIVESQLESWSDEEALALLKDQAAGTALATRLERIAPELLLAILRHGADLAGNENSRAIQEWISASPGRWSHILSPDAKVQKRLVIALDGSQSAIAEASAREDRATAQRLYDEMMAKEGATLAVGSWMEQRTVYSSESYVSALVPGARRDHHLGCDLFCPALTPIFAPMDGEIVQAGVIDIRLDYGGFLVTRHDLPVGAPLYALWGHLTHASAQKWSVGDRISEGDELALMGDYEENGWWLPHVHLQLSTIAFADFRQMPGVGEASLRGLWTELFPDPTALVLGA